MTNEIHHLHPATSYQAQFMTGTAPTYFGAKDGTSSERRKLFSELSSPLQTPGVDLGRCKSRTKDRHIDVLYTPGQQVGML